MKWKSRRRDVPERLEPSLSYGASAEEEGLDRFAKDNLSRIQYSLSPCFARRVHSLRCPV